MTYLDYLKSYHKFDLIIVLFNELGYSDKTIIEQLKTSKQNIYDAKTRVQPLISALEGVKTAKATTYGNPDINTVVEAFSASFGTTKGSKYDRFAAKRLASKHGVDAIVNIITALAASRGDQFMPSVNSVSELERKFVSVSNFLSTKVNEQELDI